MRKKGFVKGGSNAQIASQSLCHMTTSAPPIMPCSYRLDECVSAFVCIYVYTYVHICIYAYVYVYICMCTCTCICIQMYMRMYIQLDDKCTANYALQLQVRFVCECAGFVRAFIHVYENTHTHIYVYTYMYN